MPLEWKHHYIVNYNDCEKNKNKNIINEEDIYIYFEESGAFIRFNNPEKKEIINKIINTDKGRNLYKKLLQKETLNTVANNENMYKFKVKILKVLNDLIKQSKYSNFLENE